MSSGQIKTPQEKQHELVTRIFDLFGREPDEVLLTHDLWEDLRAAVDGCVHFYFALNERLESSMVPGDDALEWVRGDVQAGVDLFEDVRFGALSELKGTLPSFSWNYYENLEDLRTEYIRWFDRLRDPATERHERYHSLLVACKLQVIFLATTLI